MPLMQKELLAKMQEMMNLMLQNKEGQPVPNSSEPPSKPTGDSVMYKLAKFKKFAPEPFKEATDSNDAEEWLEELDGILETLKIEDEERMLYTESLLQGEARIWWKMEKKKRDKDELSWKEFQEIFLQRYFPTSECEKRELAFLYLK